MDRTGAPAYTWLLCLMYVCFVLNLAAAPILGWNNPLFGCTGSPGDISPLLMFHFWEPVLYKHDDSDFSSSSPELTGRWVGVSEHVGHAMTWKILTDDTQKIIHRSNVRKIGGPMSRNVRAELLDGESPTPIIKSRHDSKFSNDDLADEVDGETKELNMPVIYPTDIVGRTFLLEPQEDGQRHRARIVKEIQDHEAGVEHNPDKIKFICSVNDDEYEEILSLIHI